MQTSRRRIGLALASLAFSLPIFATGEAHAQRTPRRGQRPPAARRRTMTRAEFDRLMAAQAQAEAASNPMFGGDMTQVSGFGVGGFGGGLGTFNPAALQRFPTTIPGSQAVAAGTLVPGFGVLPPYVSPSGPLITTPGLGVFPQNNAFATDFNGFVGQSLAPSAFNGFAGQSPAPSTANPVTINGANLNVASPIPSIPPATQNPPGHR